MVSERMQRQFNRLLDDAETAVAGKDWPAVVEKARAVLAIDEANEDAISFLKMAEANGEAGSPQPVAATSSPVLNSASTPTPPLPASFVAGRYRVERFVGEGGRGRVFLARDTRLVRDVAFASIRTEGLDDLARERAMREAQSMAGLGAHPNLVAIHDIGEEGGNPHLVEEYMTGAGFRTWCWTSTLKRERPCIGCDDAHGERP